MKFIEMTGATLREIINSDELNPKDLDDVGIEDGSIVRINEHGDIEVRRTSGWDIVGGLLGEFHERVKKASGLDWS